MSRQVHNVDLRPPIPLTLTWLPPPVIPTLHSCERWYKYPVLENDTPSKFWCGAQGTLVCNDVRRGVVLGWHCCCVTTRPRDCMQREFPRFRHRCQWLNTPIDRGALILRWRSVSPGFLKFNAECVQVSLDRHICTLIRRVLVERQNSDSNSSSSSGPALGVILGGVFGVLGGLAIAGVIFYA